MAQLPTGTVTFLFTDLEGSTRLWEEHREAMKAALARHDEILREAVERHDGCVVKTTGDGLHAVFAMAPDAVAAALDAQRTLNHETWTLPEPLKVRMGLHSGGADLRDGDYYGSAVNRAARVSAAAHGGQIVASAATGDLVRDDLAPGVALVDLGEHRLRDLGRPERIVQVSHPELPGDFPALRSLDAYPGNLPVQRSAFVGRAEDLHEVRAALESAPVVTLVGVGGVGKTRLALQAAADTVSRHPDGAWFVDLGPVLDPAFVGATFSTSLALPERRQGTIEESIVASLRDKHLLVVLDNCEQVVEAVASLVDLVVDSCPGVRVLATSREALGIEGEVALAVRPLPVPPPGADYEPSTLLDNDAVRLFVDRARLVKRGFALTAETGPVVAEICQRLDGIPLAIELAAARLQALGPADILDRLDERFRLLAGGKRTVLERHQTLRGAIDWSYALLDPAEQLLFARLSMFAGGFTLEAAEAIAGDDDVDVLTFLASLISKSMVVADDREAGVRYRLLETLRDYAAERLGELDDPEAVGARHAAYYREVVERAAPLLKGADEVAVVARLGAEQDNLRAALAWSRDHDDPVAFSTMVRDLGLYWFNTGEFGDLGTWAGEAIKAAPATRADVRADLLLYLGVCANARRPGEALALLEASLACSREAGLPPNPRALSHLGVAELESNRPVEAIHHYEEGVDAARARGDAYDVLFTLSFLALGCILSGASERGLDITEEVLVGARQLGNRSLLTHALQTAGIARVTSEPELAVQLLEECEENAKDLKSGIVDQARYFRGVAYLVMGRSTDAARELRSALTIMRERGSDYFASMVVGTTAALLARDDPSLATRLLGALERFRTDHEITGAAGDLESQHRTRARLERWMDATEFAEAWARGREMTLDEAIARTDVELEKLESLEP